MRIENLTKCPFRIGYVWLPVGVSSLDLPDDLAYALRNAVTSSRCRVLAEPCEDEPVREAPTTSPIPPLGRKKSGKKKAAQKVAE
ncbi:MAG: hypothetical protein B7733_05920 [Myxococcales bacterium FL481]|nr:MAG: hypothetical protein B7733_05920 [Myxococcales bacterium FL481]